MTVLHDCLGCRTFELPPSAAVRDVKRQIEAEAGLPLAQQRLWHRGREVRAGRGGGASAGSAHPDAPVPCVGRSGCVPVLRCSSRGKHGGRLDDPHIALDGASFYHPSFCVCVVFFFLSFPEVLCVFYPNFFAKLLGRAEIHRRVLMCLFCPPAFLVSFKSRVDITVR